jgi:hypothetical protein
MAIGGTVFDCVVFAVDVAHFAQALVDRTSEPRHRVRINGSGGEKTDDWHCFLLPGRGRRSEDGRASDESEKIAPSHAKPPQAGRA